MYRLFRGVVVGVVSLDCTHDNSGTTGTFPRLLVQFPSYVVMFAVYISPDSVKMKTLDSVWRRV
jgi:hypothetical protein